jgi:hypothetical protein
MAHLKGGRGEEHLRQGFDLWLSKKATSEVKESWNSRFLKRCVFLKKRYKPDILMACQAGGFVKALKPTSLNSRQIKPRLTLFETASCN